MNQPRRMHQLILSDNGLKLAGYYCCAMQALLNAKFDHSPNRKKFAELAFNKFLQVCLVWIDEDEREYIDAMEELMTQLDAERLRKEPP